jgi:hypothetical protein
VPGRSTADIPEAQLQELALCPQAASLLDDAGL